MKHYYRKIHKRISSLLQTPSTMAAASHAVCIKLLVDTKSNKVLFAEAGKDFVDFLINLLSLPVGTVIRLLNKKNMVGSLGNLYGSIENLSDTYMQPNLDKDSLLKPRTEVTASALPMLLTGLDEDALSKKVYMCGSYHRYVADDPRAICPQCKHLLSTEVPYVAPYSGSTAANDGALSGEGGGYVKGVVTYMVMDDLVVTPMSTISGITVLNKFHVKEVGALDEKVVHVGMDEGLKLLKAALQSKSVLSSVFLSKKLG